MRIENHPTADMRKLGELIEGIETAMLTTHASDGSMVSRPLQTLSFDTNGELVFFTSAESHKIEELAENPDVNLSYANGADRRYISVRGRARIDRDRKTIDELWTTPQKIFFPLGKDDPNLTVLRIRVKDAAYWESAGNFVARAVDFAKGMLGQDPHDLGKHGVLKGNA
jgi:general stress protein 26